MEHHWTEVNDLNTSRSQSGGAGIQTAALILVEQLHI